MGVKDTWKEDQTLTLSELTGWENISLFAWVEGVINEENTPWSWCPYVIIKVNFEGRIWIPEIAQNASTPSSARISEILEVKHMTWQLETSSEPIAQDWP